MFRDRHVVIAMLVAPLLAILAWFAVGSLRGEKAAPAQAGNAYPLVEKSSCRYASGLCELENNDLRLVIRVAEDVGAVLSLESSHALDSVQLSVAGPNEEPGPRELQAAEADGRTWELSLARKPEPPQRLRIVATRSGSAFYAEASTTFLMPRDSGP